MSVARRRKAFADQALDQFDHRAQFAYAGIADLVHRLFGPVDLLFDQSPVVLQQVELILGVGDVAFGGHHDLDVEAGPLA